MSKTRTEVLDESKKKGIVAAAATTGAVAAGLLLASPVIGVVAAVPGVYFAYRWWKHRTENGIRF